MRIKFFFLVLASCLLFASCEKQEGEGGLNTIEGYVYIQNLSPTLQKIGTPYPAVDADVFIKYGSSMAIDDDEPTSDSGYFAFKFLMPGDYTIFVESADTILFNNQKSIVISQDINFSKKEQTASVDTVIIYNHLDYDDGTAFITGSVTRTIYHENLPAVEKTTIPAKDKQVFIKDIHELGIVDRYRTADDGTYKIPNIIPGEYYVYTLSEIAPPSDLTALEDSAVGAYITVYDTTTHISIPTFATHEY
ncbi:MAG: hypothetical protein PF481_06350 [Bacteroidales bacterium]|jgi:hypothetical protein|nr:hypothetical protein [Bacteroidales bacterium]